MQDDHTYILSLYEALQSGGLGSVEPEQARYALEQYTTLAGQSLGQDLRVLDEAQVRTLNDDLEYSYWFATYSHTCGEETTDYLMVHVKEPWYHLYVQQQRAWEQLSPEEQAQRDPRESFAQLMKSMQTTQDRRTQASEN